MTTAFALLLVATAFWVAALGSLFVERHWRAAVYLAAASLWLLLALAAVGR